MCVKDIMFCFVFVYCILNELWAMDASTILGWEEWSSSMYLDIALDIWIPHQVTTRTGYNLFLSGILQDISLVRRLLMQKCSMHKVKYSIGKLHQEIGFRSRAQY